jgi:trigger factor
MNISHESNDAISGIIKLEIEKNDYDAQVEKSLRQYRQKANIPGFRKGMVPAGIIRKMYGKYILAEEVTDIVTKKLSGYISDNDIKILGHPIPARTEEYPIDFETQENFTYYFDIALSPTINIKLTKRDKLTYYQLAIDDETLDAQIDSYRRNFGSYDAADDIAADDLIKGSAIELENENPKEEGLFVEKAVLMPAYIKDEKERAKFIGSKLNDAIVFNPQEAFQGSAAEVASFLNVNKETAAGITSDFRFDVHEITRHKAAEINQEFFDKLYGEGNVKSEEEFRDKVKEQVAEQIRPQSDDKFLKDIRALLIKKAGDVQFADDILKRNMASDGKNTLEEIEESYAVAKEDLKYVLIKKQIIDDNDLEFADEEVINYAKQMAKSQYAQYGMYSVPEEMLNNLARNMLKEKEKMTYIIDRVAEQKLMDWIKEKVDLTTKEVPWEEFEKLFA